MGLSTELTDLAIDVTLLMCLMPAIIIYRNYYHGRLMMERKIPAAWPTPVSSESLVSSRCTNPLCAAMAKPCQRRVRVDSRFCYRGILRTPCGA